MKPGAMQALIFAGVLLAASLPGVSAPQASVGRWCSSALQAAPEGAAGVLAGAAAAAAEGACVPRSAQSPLDEVIMFGVNPPRAEDDPRYRYPQATGVVTGDRVALLERDSNVTGHFMVWANRCVLPAREVGAGPFPDSDCKTFEARGTPGEKKRHNYKPNPWDMHLYESRGSGEKTLERYWAFFTSYRLADACTRMKVWGVLGHTRRAMRIGLDAGFGAERIRTSPYHDEHMAAARRFPVDYPLKKHSPGAQPSSVSWPQTGDPYFIDTCIVPDMSVYEDRIGRDAEDRIDHFLLDYEPQDGRSEAHTVDFISSLARELVAEFGGEKDLLISANPLNRPSAKASGITGRSIGALLPLAGIKGMTITEYRPARVYEGEQVSVEANLYRQLKIIEDAAGLLPRALREKIFVLYGLNNREGRNGARKAKLEGAQRTREFVSWYDLGGVIVWFEGSRIRSSGCDDPDWQTFMCLTLDAAYCQ